MYNAKVKRILKIFVSRMRLFFRRGLLGKILLKEIKSRIPYYKSYEIRKSYGKDMPDKTFYIIGIDEGWAGLFAILSHQLSHIAYAVERGYIPIIDLQNYYSQYLGDNELFKENAWEYFFEQPVGYRLNDIKKASNVIKSVQNANPPEACVFNVYEGFNDINKRSYYREIFAKYIKFKPQTEDFLTIKYNELLKNKGKVLGVHCRGTDYVALKPSGHPIQPSTDEVITKAREVMREYSCPYIYLATEDKDIYDLFAKHFENELILDNASRWSITDLPEGKSNSKRLSYTDKTGKIQSAMEYLAQMYLLSRCNCLVCGATAGTAGVLLMNDKYDYIYIYNLGYYV
jgi:hypothetical protein